MTIYVELKLTEPLKHAMKESAEGHNIIFGDELKSNEEKQEAVRDADIVFGNVKEPSWLDDAKRLKWIQFSSAGFDGYRKLKTRAMVTNMRDYFSQPCAETIVAGIMAIYRGIAEFTLLKQEKKWVGHQIRTDLYLLSNRNVIILGAGSIGQRIGKILAGFDCNVTFYARSSKKAIINTPDELQQAVSSADILIGALPGTAETAGLFTNQMIDAMRHNAIFCNVGRGNLVADEAYLIQALKSKRIAGAVLDVTADEPIPPGHPLWTCPSTILTQHSGGGNLTELEGIVAMFLTNLRNIESGRQPMNLVNLERGY
ncbi:MAG: D-2-hydroxyacid dehydrogenase [Chitinophagaceae bacterium]|nr:MAG: D-2-hydroxyacid dehydrogenase [Chitinophagaceae bacterium]